MHGCYKNQCLCSVPSKGSYIYFKNWIPLSWNIENSSKDGKERAEFNLGKKSLMVWLHTNNAIFPESWLWKWIHALEEGKAQHPLSSDCVCVQPHTSVSHQSIYNTMYSQYTLHLWTLRPNSIFTPCPEIQICKDSPYSTSLSTISIRAFLNR